MNVLSLFDGMSCGQIALNRAGISYDNYYASEIDKYAMQVTQANYPNTIQLGSVTEVFAKDLPQIDLLIGGSPCQGFSFAGKQLNFEDSRSKLFFEYVRLLKETSPKYFLLENVNMKQEYQDVISSYLGVRPVKINSGLWSAQNRIRLYWTNIPLFILPQDKEFVLKDIIESEVDDKYYIKGDVQYSNPNYEVNKNGISNPLKGISNKGWHFEQNVYTFESKTRSLKAGGGSGNIPKILENNGIRKLTPLECERLQTVSDDYTNVVSNSQRYRMLGNGWTIDVIVYLMKGIVEKIEYNELF